MAAKTKSGQSIPRFTIERPKAGIPAKAKIVVPRVSWESLPATLEKLIEEADSISPAFVKGTLTLY
jgi:hypothetical protein